LGGMTTLGEEPIMLVRIFDPPRPNEFMMIARFIAFSEA